MKTTDLQEAYHVSQEIDRNCYDRTVKSGQLTMSFDGNFSINHPTLGTIEISDDRVLKQVASRVGVPISYLDRISVTDPNLAAACMTSGLRNFGDYSKLRIYTQGGSTPKLRALVSPKYQSIPNSEILHSMVRDLDLSQILMQVVSVDEYDLNVLGRYIYGNEGAEVGDIFPGFSISNNEQGLGAFEVMYRLYRLWCSNGAIMAIGSARESRQVHKGNILRDGYVSKQILSRTSGFAHRIESTRDTIRTAVSMNVDVAPMYYGLRQEQSLNEAIMPQLFGAYALESAGGRGSGANLFGAVNGITRVARDAKNVNEQVKLEKLGGELLESQESRIRRLEAVGTKWIAEQTDKGRKPVFSTN